MTCFTSLLSASLAACATPAAPAPTASRVPDPTALLATPAPASPSPAPSPSPEAAASATPAAARATPLIWANLAPDRAAALGALLPTLSVSATLTAHPGDLATDVRAAKLAGRPLPDLLIGTQDDLAALAAAKIIAPLPPDGLSGILPAAAAGANFENQVWGQPLAATDFLLLLSNTRIITATPGTSDDLIRLAREQNAVQDQFGLVAAWAEPRWLLGWLDAAGGAPLDSGGNPSLDTPQMVSALNLWKELRGFGPPPPSSYEQSQRLFRRGAAAFMIDGGWGLADYRTYSQTLDLAVAPLPPLAATGSAPAAPLGGLYLLSVSGTDPALAREVAQRLSAPTAQPQLAAAIGALPALSAALSDPLIQRDAALAAAARTAARAPGTPATKAYRCAWRAIEENIAPVLRNEIPPPEGAKRMQAQAVACVGG